MSKFNVIMLVVILTGFTAVLRWSFVIGRDAGRNEIFSGFAYDLQALEGNCFDKLDREKGFFEEFSHLKYRNPPTN